MRKVALAITGLLLTLGGGAHGKTMPAQGPSPWCEGHAELPTGNAVTASAGVERGRSATGVFACVEVAGGGSRPATAEVVRAWADPDEAQAAVECVPHRDARVAKGCYKRADTPADDRRKAHGLHAPPIDPSAGISVETLTPEHCQSLPTTGWPECIESHRIAVGADPDSGSVHVMADEESVDEEDMPAVASEVEQNVPGR
jgi:hypothetical protein